MIKINPLNPTCEICGEVVTRVETATKCGHPVYLCATCKRTCPGALRECVTCESKDHDDECPNCGEVCGEHAEDCPSNK